MHKLVTVWKNICVFNMLTLHISKVDKVVVISISSVVLLRPLRSTTKSRKFVLEGPLVDSMCVYYSDTMSYLDTIFPGREDKPKQFGYATSRCIPFSGYATKPRTGLGIEMLPLAVVVVLEGNPYIVRDTVNVLGSDL